MAGIDKSKIVGSAIEDEYIIGDSFTQDVMNDFESQAVSGYTIRMEGVSARIGATFDKGGTGWHYAYDSTVDDSYMYNDDPDSKYYKYFLSYESPISLQAKLDYINSEGLAGVIIWECSQDAADFSMITQIAYNLLLTNTGAKLYDTSGNLVKNAIVGMTSADNVTRAVYAKADGTMAAGEIITYQGAQYYCDNNGTIALNNIITFNGSRYYASESGKLVTSTGMINFNGNKYYVGVDGKIVASKIFRVDDKQYYAAENGALATNKIIKYTVNQYCVDKAGVIVKGKWVTVGKTKYYCSPTIGKITKSKTVK